MHEIGDLLSTMPCNPAQNTIAQYNDTATTQRGSFLSRTIRHYVRKLAEWHLLSGRTFSKDYLEIQHK